MLPQVWNGDKFYISVGMHKHAAVRKMTSLVRLQYHAALEKIDYECAFAGPYSRGTYLNDGATV